MAGGIIQLVNRLFLLISYIIGHSMTVCMFASCNSNKRTKTRSYFTVPKARKLMKSWLERSKRADLTLADVANGSYVVCDLHFSSCQLYTEWHGTRLRLRVREGEVPQPECDTLTDLFTVAERCLALNSGQDVDDNATAPHGSTASNAQSGEGGAGPACKPKDDVNYVESVRPAPSGRTSRLVSRRKVSRKTFAYYYVVYLQLCNSWLFSALLSCLFT